MKDNEKEMSFLGHLEVLRWHLIRSVVSVLIFTTLSFYFKDIVFDRILLGPKNSEFITYRFFCYLSDLFGFGDFLCFGDFEWTLNNFTMSGQFSAHIMISIFSGLILSFPYIFWELWRFVSPALKHKERAFSRGVVFFASTLFFLGVLFGYYIVSPLAINFLGSYQVSSEVANQISLTSFIMTVATISFANGIVFELPILVYFLTKAGLITPEFMRKYRKHSMILILLLSAIITPPDVISQILLALPLLVLYEISINISARILRK